MSIREPVSSSRVSSLQPAVWSLLQPRIPGCCSRCCSAPSRSAAPLALATVAAWLITRAWQMPPVLDLTVAVVAVQALGISRGVFSYCERLAIHDTALRAAGNTRVGLYRRLTDVPPETALRLHSGDLVARVGASVDDLADVLVRAILPMCVAAILSGAAVVIIALISPAAAAILAACLLVAGVAAPWLSGAPPRHRSAGGPTSQRPRHRRPAGAGTCGRTSGGGSPRSGDRRSCAGTP